MDYVHGNSFEKRELGGRGEKLSLIGQNRAHASVVIVRVDKYRAGPVLDVAGPTLELGYRFYPIALTGKGTDKKAKVLSRGVNPKIYPFRDVLLKPITYFIFNFVAERDEGHKNTFNWLQRKSG